MIAIVKWHADKAILCWTRVLVCVCVSTRALARDVRMYSGKCLAAFETLSMSDGKSTAIMYYWSARMSAAIFFVVGVSNEPFHKN